MNKRKTFAQIFREQNGRDLTAPDLERILREQFGIEPSPDGSYSREQFEPAFQKYLDGKKDN